MPPSRKKRPASRKTQDATSVPTSKSGPARSNSVPVLDDPMTNSPPMTGIPSDSDFSFTSSLNTQGNSKCETPLSSIPSQQSTSGRKPGSKSTGGSGPSGSKGPRSTTRSSTGPAAPVNGTKGPRATTQANQDAETNDEPKDQEQLAEIKKEEGNVQFRLKKFTDAVLLYTEAIKLDPKNPAYLANRAAALMSIKRYVPALADMQLATSPALCQAEPDAKPSSKNLLRLIRCHVALGQLFQARQVLTSLLNQSPNLPEANKELKRLDDLERILTTVEKNRARQDWSMVIIGLDKLQREVEGGTLISKEWIGWKVEALCGKKRWEEAQSLSIDLVRNHSSDPEALYYRALVMYLQGNLPVTVTHCQEAMRCDPDFTKARDLLRKCRAIETAKEAGNAAFKAANYATAIEKYLQAAAIDPKNDAITVTLDSNRAQSLYKLTRCSEAIEVCTQILKIDGKHFKALRTRARAQVAELDFDAAIADFQTAAKHSPSDKEKTEILREIKLTKVKLAKSKYKDHYKILGVSRNAADDEIKKAFRRQSLIHHPDKGGNEEKFKEINEAYMVLQDPTSRRQFDMVDPENPESGCCHGGGSGFDDDEMPINMADLFGTSFRGGGSTRFRTSSGFGGSPFFPTGDF